MNGTRQRGVVLITAVLLVALAASVATFLVWRQSLWVRQLENLRAQSQAALIAKSGVDLARVLLNAQKAIADKATGRWHVTLPPLPAEDGTLSGDIRDEQGLLNLNNVAQSPTDYDAFSRLLVALNLPATLAATLRDWIDVDDLVSDGGAEDARYLSLDPPYRTANQPLTDINNLYRVMGYDEKSINAIRPFVTVLPLGVRLNVNTAPAEVLAAYFNLPDVAAQTLVASRTTARFIDPSDFANRFPQRSANIAATQVAFVSNYFVVTTSAKFGTAQASVEALLDRSGPYPKVVWLRPRAS